MEEHALRQRVLVIEDELILAQNLKCYLVQKDLAVRVATQGSSAIELAMSYRPTLIVLDYHLPDMNGFAVLQALGEQWSYRCLLITGHPTCAVCEMAAQHGVQYILFKPFPLRDLGEAVQILLAGPQAPNVMHLYDGAWRTVEREHLADVFPLPTQSDGEIQQR